MKKLYAIVDLGATNVRVAQGEDSGIKKKITEPTNIDGGSHGVTAQIKRMIESLDIEKIIAIGVGSIGPLNLKTGCISNAPNLPFKMIPIVEPLSKEFNVPVKLMNDCSAAVLGEQTYGAGRGMSDLVYVTLSTGLGGGAMVDGNLLLGKDGNAVEIGHFTIDPDSELVCGCGCKGHWEAYCSGKNIPNFTRLLMREREWKESLLFDLVAGVPERISTENLFNAATNGDEFSLWIVDKIGKVNAIGFADIVNAFDPELISIGGAVALRNPKLILNPIEENIEMHLINRKPEIRITPLGEDAVLNGALVLAINASSKI